MKAVIPKRDKVIKIRYNEGGNVKDASMDMERCVV